MVKFIPDKEELKALIGTNLYGVWQNLCSAIEEEYDTSQTYHDGKWMVFEPTDCSFFEDFISLLKINRNPNRK